MKPMHILIELQTCQEKWRPKNVVLATNLALSAPPPALALLAPELVVVKEEGQSVFPNLS